MPQVIDPQPGTRSGESSGPSSPATGPAGGAAVARGKVLEARGGVVIFQPRGTNYELHLETSGEFEGPINKPTMGVVHVKARKLYTVPSGGNFIAPILGTPRTVQGRVVWVSPTQIILQAGTPVLVDIPAEPHAVDLGSGPIEEGAIVNVVALPGATYEPQS
jgi:hypothetical protein